MEVARSEIMSGVWLSHIRTDKFKTACLSVSLLTQLKRETAAMNALLPQVLRRGTALYGDMEAISRRLDELYGAAIEPVVRRLGEIQCVGFFASVPEEDLLPAGADTLRGTCELLGQLLCAPNTRGGLLLPQYVDSERDKLLEAIRARLNDKLGWAVSRCIEEMCCGEDYAVNRLGDEESAEAIRYQKLTKQYRALLQESPIEIFYCGRADRRRVESLLRDALSTLPRGEINYDIGTDVRFNALEDEPRRYCEQMNVAQAKLVIGWRLGEAMEEPDPAALRVFSSLFGGGSTASKLFVNVREKLSLCYFASSLCDAHKGVLLAYAGTDAERVEEAKDEILAQLAAIARGCECDIESGQGGCAQRAARRPRQPGRAGGLHALRRRLRRGLHARGARRARGRGHGRAACGDRARLRMRYDLYPRRRRKRRRGGRRGRRDLPERGRAPRL